MIGSLKRRGLIAPWLLSLVDAGAQVTDQLVRKATATH